MKQLTVFLLCLTFLGSYFLFIQCQQAGTGSISGQVISGGYVPPGEEGEGTSLCVGLYTKEGKPVSIMPLKGCWPPDTCPWRMADVKLGEELVIVAELIDTLYISTGGKEGNRKVLSYFAEDPMQGKNLKYAKSITLTSEQPEITGIDIVVMGEEPQTEGM
jgi:hypothetical protein